MPELKLYTVAQVRDWLEHKKVAEGLTSEVIRPAFAWALIHNPFVKDDDPIVAAIYEDGVLAAATCAYPEILEKPQVEDELGQKQRIWWFPTLWVKPEFRGKAYGLIVVGSLAEIYGEENSWTAWAVPESIEIFEHLGCKTYYFPHYFLEKKRIKTTTLIGKLSAMRQNSEIAYKNFLKPVLPHYDYTLRYLTNVDNESYEFICRHNENHFFQASQAMLNWYVQYPWSISSLLPNRVHKEGMYFSDIYYMEHHSFVQVWNRDELVGLYRLCLTNSSLSCDSIYYKQAYSEFVYASVLEHIEQLNIVNFDTEDVGLSIFVNKYRYFPKHFTDQISLSVSRNLSVPDKIIR